ncbi:hypothetical protein PCASD_00593 [Puccinia coronata f. sp. avenae]|uniref:Uncharacterized protein n=1 Tax=Puccinia coronata f. sp. avenae TaxID=200324 RepID=A0A2N5VNP4_9BASI|nr:hypothetical protein PCASD_00593 [Puccinia coronata f. sp. avenae]
MDFIIKTALAFLSQKFSVHSSQQSLRENILTDLSDCTTKFPNAVQQSLSKTLLKEYISHSPEDILIMHWTEPLSISHPIVSHNMELKKEEAVKKTLKLKEEGEGASESIFIYTDGSFDESKGGAAAAVAPNQKIIYTMALGKTCIISNHKCEAYGVFLAATMLTQVVTEKITDAYILVDNQGVINRMKYIACPKLGTILILLHHGHSKCPSTYTHNSFGLVSGSSGDNRQQDGRLCPKGSMQTE